MDWHATLAQNLTGLVLIGSFVYLAIIEPILGFIDDVRRRWRRNRDIDRREKQAQ